MTPHTAERPSGPPAAWALLREITADALQYREVRRIVYNALLDGLLVGFAFAAVLTHFVSMGLFTKPGG